MYLCICIQIWGKGIKDHTVPQSIIQEAILKQWSSNPNLLRLFISRVSHACPLEISNQVLHEVAGVWKGYFSALNAYI